MNVADQLADEIYGLHCDIGRLEQENATLRQQLADATESMGRVEERHAKTFEVGKRWMAKAARFEAENTKLRELAARAWLLFMEHGAVHPCELSEVDAVRDGLRELGVEV